MNLEELIKEVCKRDNYDKKKCKRLSSRDYLLLFKEYKILQTNLLNIIKELIIGLNSIVTFNKIHEDFVMRVERFLNFMIDFKIKSALYRFIQKFKIHEEYVEKENAKKLKSLVYSILNIIINVFDNNNSILTNELLVDIDSKYYELRLLHLNVSNAKKQRFFTIQNIVCNDNHTSDSDRELTPKFSPNNQFKKI
jgi:hypothetical protein